ncbi:DUF2059 domain-containing protein [Oceanicola sp. 502str15]|uniref:DUF2059 domain-containing protein n=1 Tax=Oceanicola sp. 502str15 TaxID=2696061 RepID=UPI002095AF5C|nr:DUF2059 domain-containing protein [Oceanicola sp. 502str15]MCO6382337.1 DUF2059 domain-containing protein [Oceanicola sp. 502str15]
MLAALSLSGSGQALWAEAGAGGGAPQSEAATAAPLGEAETQALMVALGMDRLMPILRDEGLAYSTALERELFPGAGGKAWADLVSEIYATDRLERVMARRFAAEMAGVDVAPLMAFFDSDRGRRIVGLEISARAALLDDTVEQMSRDAFSEMRGEDSPRLDLLRAYIESNDLVETNIAGALNSNFAFYQGLAAGGALPPEMSEEEMLRDVWMQEPDIREETETWVWSYLAMAYEPLEDADIEAYTALSQTPEGRALNRAIFAGFDELFADISRDLGLAASRFMVSEDI